MSERKTILQLPTAEALSWCEQARTRLVLLALKEELFISASSAYVAESVGRMMRDGRRCRSIHLNRIAELKNSDNAITDELLPFLQHLEEALTGKRRFPFAANMSQADARSWLAAMRKKLAAKIRRERRYLAQCKEELEEPFEEAATEADSAMQEDILLLVRELLATFPPEKLPRPKTAG